MLQRASTTSGSAPLARGALPRGLAWMPGGGGDEVGWEDGVERDGAEHKG